MDDVNRSSVIVNLSDVSGKTITDQVEMTFYNQRSQSLNQRFKVRFKGAPVTLPECTGVPCRPGRGIHKSPRNTDPRLSSLMCLPANPRELREKFLVDPKRVSPVFPTFNELQTEAEVECSDKSIERVGNFERSRLG